MFPFRRMNSFLTRTLLTFILLSTTLFLVFGLSKHFLQNNDPHRFTDDHQHLHHHRHPIAPSSTVEKRRLLQQNDSTSDTLPSTATKIGNKPVPIYVHFDLKGAAPKLSYFEQLFPLLRQWGAEGICMEYEDVFPFEGLVASVKHQQAYSKADIQQINQLAEANHLDVMPLLQTYGKGGRLPFFVSLVDRVFFRTFGVCLEIKRIRRSKRKSSIPSSD